MAAEAMTVIEAKVAEAVAFIRARVSKAPAMAIVCGSGLGSLADTIAEATVLDYADIPHFHVSSVHGHAGKLVFGTLGGKFVVAMKGRFHFYEGYPAAEVAMPMRVFAALGAKAVLVTNAAGGISADLSVGDVMVIRDHLYIPGLAGNHALAGRNPSRFGSRFVPMQGTYRAELAELAVRLATARGLTVHQGVYACVSGPTFESPAEARALRALGADVVGMSTAPEVAAAAHCGLAVLALSLVTNKVALAPAFGASKDLARGSDAEGVPSHEEVLEAVKLAEKGLQGFAVDFVAGIDLAALKPPRAAALDWAEEARAAGPLLAGGEASERSPADGVSPVAVAVLAGAAAGAIAGFLAARIGSSS